MYTTAEVESRGTIAIFVAEIPFPPMCEPWMHKKNPICFRREISDAGLFLCVKVIVVPTLI
jgi:hypothetical protein